MVETKTIDVIAENQNEVVMKYEMFGQRFVSATLYNSNEFISQTVNKELHTDEKVKITFQRDLSIHISFPELRQLEQQYHDLKPPVHNLVSPNTIVAFDHFTSEVAKRNRLLTIIVCVILIPITIIGSEIIPGWFGIGLVINILTIIVLFLAAFTDIHKKWEYRKYLKNAEIYNVKVPELQ